MARTVAFAAIGALAALAAGTATPALAACNIDNTGEIVNPFEPGCGDVMLTYTEADNTGNNVALGYPVPIPVASLTPVDGFRQYASLFARHQALLTLHDEVAGQVVGQTVANRDIWAYVISDTDTTIPDGFTAEGAAVINGGIHAREWQTPEAVTALFETLVERKNDGGLGQYLVENVTTIIVPVNNVDGFLTTQRYANRATATRDQPREGRMRRKNLRNPQTLAAIDDDIATIADNFWGVDLNRNSLQGFGLFERSSLSPTSLVFRSTPHSEPELDALIDAAALVAPTRLRLFSDTHSFGQVFFAPTTLNPRRNAITAALAGRMAAASGRTYLYSPDPPDSPGIGTTADHFAFRFQIPSWTLEVEPVNGGQDYGGVATHGHSGFVLPDREAARMREDVTRMYLLGLYRQSGPPAALAAQIRDLQSAEVVYDAQWSSGPLGVRGLTVATNRALLAGRNYRLWVAFSKPMRVRDSGGTVVPYRGQSTGAAVGTVRLEIPSLTGQDITLANGTWLNTPGGAPGGYLRYADDAFAVDFTIPATLSVAAATPAVIALGVADLAEMSVDADPATVVEWGGAGNWIRYESVTGVQGDVGGGPDCFFRPFVASQAGAAPPANTVACRAATPPPPPPPPSGGGGGGGGGGGLEFATLLLLVFLVALTRESLARSWLRRPSPAPSQVLNRRADPRAGRSRS